MTERGEELIIKYFNRSITESEMEELNELLEKNEEFSKQFSFEKNVQKAIQKNEFDRLELKMDEWEQEPVTEKGKVVPMNRKFSFSRWQAAAAVAILILCGYFGLQFLNQPDTEQLISKYYSIYPNTEYNITRGGEPAEDAQFEAFLAYEEGDYDKAGELFLKISNTEDYGYFYAAQSFYANNDYERALANYEQIIKNNTVFVPESYWYGALTNLVLENKEEAKTKLQTLVDEFDYKQQEAQKLLKQLN